MDSVLVNLILKHQELLSSVDTEDADKYFQILEKIDNLSKCLKHDFPEQCEQAVGHSTIKEYNRLISLAQECVINGFYFKLEKEKMFLYGPNNFVAMHELIPANKIAISISNADFTEDQTNLMVLYVSDSNSIYLINFAIALTKVD